MTTREAESTIDVRVEPRLRAEIASRSLGRVLVIDYFATQRCGTVTGDLTVRFSPAPGPVGFVELAPVEGVRVFANERLSGLLRAAGPTLRLSGLSVLRRPAITLDRPELWIDFLDRPVATLGKRTGLRRAG